MSERASRQRAAVSIPPMSEPITYYEWSAGERTHHPPLESCVRVDVCVIGGGFTGLAAALSLAERGYEVCLLEAKRIGYGASGRNGGQLGSGQRQGVRYLERAFGPSRARLMWDLAEEAKALLRSRIAEHAIDCHYRAGNLLAITRESFVDNLARECQHLARYYDYPHLQMLSRGEMRATVASSDYVAGRMDYGGGHLHPLRYALGLARAAVQRGVRIHEMSRVLSVQWAATPRALTAQGEVQADYVVFCTNAYADDSLEPRIGGRALPIVNHVLTTEALGEARMNDVIRNGACVHSSRFVVDYYRFSNDSRLIFGGGETYTARPPPDLKSFVRGHMLRVFPQLQDVRIDFAWSGWLAVSVNRLPVFGRVGARGFYAHGFSGHGVALSQIAGRLLAEAVAGDAERFDVMANVEHRRFPGGRWLRHPLMVAGMLWASLMDKL